MNIHDLREAQVRYKNRIEEINEERKKLHQLREKFTKYFNLDRIATMKLDDYVLGVVRPKIGRNFSYALEIELDSLGSISGSPAPKFGVYYGVRGEKGKGYQFVKRLGDTYQEAFKKIKESLLELLEAGENENIEAIKDNLISPMLKGKILSTYFPKRYLNIFSPDHLNYYLAQLGLDTAELIKADPVYKREELIRFKNQDEVMKNWNVDLFAKFLYSEYP